LVLPPPGEPTTITKRIYDLTGTFAGILILNYVAAPFMLLTFSDSIEAWRRLHWYGFWMIGSTLAFFWLGGSSFLKALQKKEGKVAEKVMTPESHVMPPPLDDVAEELKELQQRMKE
jgi:lysophospholipid acyltransferase